MSDPPNFDELIGPELPPGDRERLRRVHELLVAAGPPPEMPELHASPPVRAHPRRRVAALLIAAALALAAFGAGWLLSAPNDEFDVRRAVPMHSTANAPNASALIELGYADDEGNWPMLVTVRGLKPLPKGGYYELLLTRERQACRRVRIVQGQVGGRDARCDSARRTTCATSTAG